VAEETPAADSAPENFNPFNVFVQDLSETIVTGTQAFATVSDIIQGTTEPVTNTAQAGAGTPQAGADSVTPPAPNLSFDTVTNFFKANIFPIGVGILSIIGIAGLIKILK